MARQQFHSFQEILSEDMNNFRNATEKAIFELFLGNSIPNFPSFIASSMRPVVTGNTVTLSQGIGFQQIPQTDGSTSVRVIKLSGNLEIEFTDLPTGQDTRTDLIEIKSVVADTLTENRNFTVQGVVQERPTIIQNDWSYQVNTKKGVTLDADGNYAGSEGFVPVCAVELSSSGITRVTDLRNFYNIFDPDFFSVYGRKNNSFTQKYDNINYIEVPFEFSDLVEKLKQISVRRVSEGLLRSSATVTQNSRDYDFIFNEPTSTSRTLAIKGFLAYATRNVNMTIGSVGSFIVTDRFDPIRDICDFIDGRFDLRTSDLTHIDINLTTDEYSLLNSLPDTGIYIHAWKSTSAPSLSNSIIWRLPKSSIGIDSNDFDWTGRISPLFRSEDLSYSFNVIRLSTVNPLTQAAGNPNYVDTVVSHGIPSFYQISNLQYNPPTKRLSWTLKDTTIGTTGTGFSGARDTSKDFLSLGLSRPQGLWSDGTTMWISTYGDRSKIFAFNIATRQRDSAKDITLDSNNNNPQCIWSDGTTMYVVDYYSKIFAYTIATRQRDVSKDITLTRSATGIWGNSTTIWVSSYGHNVIEAYTISSKSRDSSKDITINTNRGNEGIWSDGVTMWVANDTASRVSAYNISTGARDSTKDFNVGINGSEGLWSNGLTMYISNARTNQVNAYTLSTQRFVNAFDPSRIFTSINLKKGSEIRLNAIPYSSLNVTTYPATDTAKGNQADFYYTLSASENVILPADTVFNNFELEFIQRVGFAGFQTKETTILRPGTDFSVHEEGTKTFVNLASGLRIPVGADLIFSHVVPQELVESDSGTPEESGVAESIAALRNQITTLTNSLSANSNRIQALQATVGQSSQTILYYGFSAVQGSASDQSSIATPIVTSFITASDGSDLSIKNVSNIKTVGASLNLTAPSQTGFYYLMVLIEEDKAGRVSFFNETFDETDLWSSLSATKTLLLKNYKVFYRTQTLADNDTIRLRVQEFD